MSILIKGMEMPKSCEECALNYDSFACIKTGNRFYRNDRETDFDPFKGRLEDCPLIPVPPHGRLGDLDELERRIKEEGANQAEQYGDRRHPVVMAYGDCFGKVKSAPTIIPAEEETA